MGSDSRRDDCETRYSVYISQMFLNFRFTTNTHTVYELRLDHVAMSSVFYTINE